MSEDGYKIRTGVTEETWRSMIVDVGVVYVNYGEADERRLGATDGGVTFGWNEYETRAPEIDGLKGRLAGTTRITQASPQIEVNLVEWSRKNMEIAFPGAETEWDGDKGVYVLKRSTRVLPLSAFPKNLAVVGTQSGTGKAVVMMIKLPQVIDGAEIPMEDDNEATASLTFVGHYSADDPEEEPWEIHWPEDGTVMIEPYTVQDGDTSVVAKVDLQAEDDAHLAVFDEGPDPADNITDGDSVHVTEDGAVSITLDGPVSEGDRLTVRAYETDALDREIGRAHVEVKEAP